MMDKANKETVLSEAPPPLGGEADQSSWYFGIDDCDGPYPNAIGHTFPLLTHDRNGRWRLVGTGFYVSEDGLFVTARHVIEEVLDNGQQVLPLIILHQRAGGFAVSEVLHRPISQCWLSAKADVAFGVAATATSMRTGEVLQHWCWPLVWSDLKAGQVIGTYAFPRHTLSEDGTNFSFAPELYLGSVLAFSDYRDSVMIPFPYLEVNCRVHGAASGGPIALNDGGVIGVNCSELAETTDHPPGPAFAAQIKCLEGAYIDDAMLLGETVRRRVTFDELVRVGAIKATNYGGSSNQGSAEGLLVRLDLVSVSAGPPSISFVQYL